MKLILIILFFVPCLLNAQSDTVGTQRFISKAGVINIDTLRISSNSSSWIDLYLTGTTGKNFCRAKKSLYITNLSGVYKIVSNTNPIAFTGLTGASWGVEVSAFGVIVKITGTTEITDWKITRLNY